MTLKPFLLSGTFTRGRLNVAMGFGWFVKPWLIWHFNWYPSLGSNVFSILEEERHRTEVWSEYGVCLLLALFFSMQYWANNHHFFGDILGICKRSKSWVKWLSFKNVSLLRNKLNCKRWNLLIPEENLFVYFFLSEYFMLSTPLFERGIWFQSVLNIWHPEAGM